MGHPGKKRHDKQKKANGDWNRRHFKSRIWDPVRTALLANCMWRGVKRINP